MIILGEKILEKELSQKLLSSRKYTTGLLRILL